ncbi:hypothetical protein ACWFQ8_32045 [Streptomyces sp. NPDC055254]
MWFRFSEDLITLQRAWQQTYAELAQAPAGAGTTEDLAAAAGI